MCRGERYRFSGSIRADESRAITVGAYMVDSAGVHKAMSLTAPDPFSREIALAATAGVNFVSFMVPKSVWTDDESYDFLELDRISDKILAVNPHALLLPRIKIDTDGWWAQKHPDDQMVYDDGSRPGVPCISSRLYREKSVKFLAAFTRHMCAKYPDNFAGIHPAAQNSCEWFYWDGWSRPFNGYDPATLSAWRTWCAGHGIPDAENAEVPSAESRRDASRGLLRDPVADRMVIAFSQFQQEEMADFIAAAAKGCREASEGKKLVVFFYGYQWEFAKHDQGPAVSGHLGLQHLLDAAADDIDILCSPISYTDRAWEGCGLGMSAEETVMRHGVLWLWEDDTRTYLEPDKAAYAGTGVCQTLQETQEVLRRNTVQEIMRGFGCWWMDLLASGWYESPELWSEMSGLAALDRTMLERQPPFVPEVAAVADERSMLAVASGTVTGRCMDSARKGLARGGAPYGQYLLSDVLRNGLAARLQIFESAFYADAETIAAVAAQRTAHPEVTRVWCWAPGYLTGTGPSVAGTEALTGFKVRTVSLADAKPRATAAGRAVGLPESWGEEGAVNPLLAVVARAGDEIWATYADGSPAIVLRGREVFVGSPDWCTELVRALERRAEVHNYILSGEASVWASEGWLSVRALKDGALVVDTGKSDDVVDYYTGERVATGPLVTVKARRGETRIWKIVSDAPTRKTIAIGDGRTGGVKVPAGESVELADVVLLGDGGVFCKTGSGTLEVPMAKVDRQAGGWEIRNCAGEMRLVAGEDTTAPEVPSVITEKAALWLRADSAVVTNGTDGATGFVKRWVDVRDLGNSDSPRQVYAMPEWGSMAPAENRGLPPVLVETNGTAALYFGGNTSGRYMRLSSEVKNIRQSFVVHGMYDCWGAVLGNSHSRKAMIPDTYKGSVAAAELTRHFSLRTELSPAYSSARYRLDGEEFDPFTVPPRTGFQLLEMDFPAQSDSVDCIFRSGFETVVDKDTGLDKQVQGGDYVSEIVLFTNVVSEAERLEVERYLMRRWSLARTDNAPGTVTAAADSVVEIFADEGEVFPAVNLKGGGVFRKTGAGTQVRVDEIADGVKRLEVEEGALVLGGGVQKRSDFAVESPEPVLVVNGDFELPFKISNADGRGILYDGENRQNGWMGTGAYVASTNAGSVWLGDVTVPPPSGSQALVLSLGTYASTTVELPAEGWYELTVRAKNRFGTGAGVSHRKYINEVEVLFGETDDSLEHVGYLWPSGVGYGRYAFTLPRAGKGRHILKFASTQRAYDGAMLLDDVEIRALAYAPESGSIKVPNGGFERLVPGSWAEQGTGAWTGVLSPVDNIPEGWTFDASGSSCPDAAVNGSVGVASPAFSPSGEAAMVCGLGDLVRGPSRLFFFGSGGRASTTFTLPAGRYRLQAEMARHNLAMRVGGATEKIKEDAPVFTASVTTGVGAVDLGAVRADSFLSQGLCMPNELLLTESGEVTLTLSQSAVNGAGWLDNLEFVAVGDDPAGGSDEVPWIAKGLQISVSDGARLRLDFNGVRKIRGLRLGGTEVLSGTIGAEDYPGYLEGVGRLQIVPSGTMLYLR